MDTNPQQNLEELIHRELSKLPEQKAPETLVPRVIAQIQARARRHWWQRSWSHWPFGIQLASVPFLMMGMVGAMFGLSALWNFSLSRVEYGAVTPSFDGLAAGWGFLGALGNAVLVFGRAAGQQWLWLALFVPLIMYLACVGLGTLCYRVAYSSR
jgi:hypothetical protein